jgi:Kef-type K+ transport system membrane component KefB
MTVTELAPRFFIALAVILVFCRLVSWLLGRVGQPAVVAEMLAGVLLGPSLFGWLLPHLQAQVFPADLKPVLYVVGQLGLVIFMFQAGYEFTEHRVAGLAGTAGAISLAGVSAPLVLGVLLTLASSGHGTLFVPGVSLGVSAAFVGVALAITAFPMLARIITERGLAGTRHGSISLASGALDDVIAWIGLAFVLAVAAGQLRPGLTAVVGATAFGLVIWYVGRPLASWLLTPGRLSTEQRMLAAVVLLLIVAWYTDEIGLYAVFGAFCIGAIMPHGPETQAVMDSVAPVARIVFLPVFFTYSGLQTQFGVLGQPAVLLFAVGCVVAAIVGKFGACWGAARLRGESAGTSARIGALMNARGLMQLIALNAGLAAGIVNHRLFTALVLVALVTTLMTTPLLSWLDRRDLRAGRELEEADARLLLEGEALPAVR